MRASAGIVGRNSELNRLELQVMKAINGRGSVVNIIGEAGIGKSWLTAELKRREVMKKVILSESIVGTDWFELWRRSHFHLFGERS